mgnify:CR=1 FL=1
MRVHYRVDYQQTMVMRRRPRPWWEQLLFGPAPFEWVGHGGAAGHTYVDQELDPYGLGAPYYTPRTNSSDCTMIVPGTED